MKDSEIELESIDDKFDDNERLKSTVIKRNILKLQQTTSSSHCNFYIKVSSSKKYCSNICQLILHWYASPSFTRTINL